jgi:hypothetical protein
MPLRAHTIVTDSARLRTSVEERPFRAASSPKGRSDFSPLRLGTRDSERASIIS